MNDLVATHNDEDSLTYIDAPDTDFSEGDKLSVMDTIQLNLDGTLRSVPITYVEITSVSVEYVVPEREWYIRYSVKHVAPDGRSVSTETLTPEDLTEGINDGWLIETDKPKDELLTEHQSGGIQF